MSDNTTRKTTLEEGIAVYDLDDLSKESSSVSKQYKDPKYLNVAVHFKKGTSKCSFLLPLNNIGAYFAVADGLTYGTVKLFKSNLLSQIAKVDRVTADSVYADFAISVAAADNRYVRTYDGTDTGGNDSSSQFVKTDESGYINPSFFNFTSSAKISGIGRYKPDRKLLVGSTFGEDNISKFYALYSISEKDSFMLSDPTKSDSFMQNFESPEKIAANISTCVTIDLSELSVGEKNGTIAPSGEYISNWAQLYTTTKDYSTFVVTDDKANNELSVTGSIDTGTSFTVGYGNIAGGEANLLTGYNNQAYQGKGNIMTGLKNINSSHFGVNNGISNTDKQGFCNYVTGRFNDIQYSHSSFISGNSNKYSNLISTLALAYRSIVTAADRCVLLGGQYNLKFGSNSVLLLASPDTTLNKITRSILTGQHVICSTGEVIDSLTVLNGENEDKVNIYKIDRSIVSAYKLKTKKVVSQSILIGSGITDGETADSDTECISKSIMAGTNSTITGIITSMASAGSSKLNTVTFSNIAGNYTEASNVVASMLATSGTSASTFKLNSITSSIVAGSGASSLSTINASVVAANESSIVAISNSTVTLSASNIKTLIKNSVVAGISYTNTQTETSVVLASELNLTNVSRSIVTVATSTITGISGSYVNITGATINQITDSLVLGSKIHATTIKDSIINIKSKTSASNSVTQSLMIGDLELNGAVEDSIVMGDSHDVESILGSLVSGRSHTLKSTNYAFLSGYTNKLTNGAGSMVVGQSNTVSDMINSVVLGSSNSAAVSSNTASSTIIGISNTISSASSSSYCAVFGRGNNVRGVNNLTVLGTNNSSSATSLMNSIILGSGNSISGSSSVSAMILGKDNNITASYSGSYVALGIGLINYLSYYTDSTVLIGTYNDTQDSALKEVSEELGSSYSYDLSMVVGVGSGSSGRRNAMYAGYDRSRGIPFVFASGDMHAKTYRSQKTGYAETVTMYVNTGGSVSSPRMAVQPCRLLEIILRNGNDGSKFATLQLNETGASNAGYVMADPIYNQPAIVAGNADIPINTPGVTLAHRESAISGWQGFTYKSVDLIMTGTVTVEEDGSCVVGGYCCARKYGANDPNSGIVQAADGVNTWDYIVVDKFQMTQNGVTKKYVRLVLR